jgi:hypothetical protein
MAGVGNANSILSENLNDRGNLEILGITVNMILKCI